MNKLEESKYIGFKVSDVTYPFDSTGHAETNRIDRELHTVMSGRHRDYFTIIPRYAPFFQRELEVYMRSGQNQEIRKLEEEVDYYITLPYGGFTAQFGTLVSGGITLINPELDGVVWVTYNTIGGDNINDPNVILNKMIEKAWNPRQTFWDNLIHVPNRFPSTEHLHNIDEMMGFDDMVGSMRDLVKTIAEKGKDQTQAVRDFIASFDPIMYKKLAKALDEHSYFIHQEQINMLATRLTAMEAKLNRLGK